MKKFLAAAAAVTLTMIAAPAFAQTIDGSIAYTSFRDDDIDLGAVQGALSWRSSNFIGVEGEAAFGIKDEDIGPGASIELNSEVGLYVTANADISENATIYARLGYAHIDVGSNVGIEDSEGGVAYGVGAKFFLDGKNGVRLDYTHFGSDLDIDAWSIGYVRRFR